MIDSRVRFRRRVSSSITQIGAERRSTSWTPCGIRRSTSAGPHRRAQNPSTFRPRSLSNGARSTLLARTPAKKTSSRNSLAGGNDRSDRAQVDADRTFALCEPALWFDNVDAGASPVRGLDRIVAVLGGHRDVEVQAHCKPDGVVSLKSLAISGFLTIRVPRVWDVAWRRGTRATSLVDWRAGSRLRLPSMSGRRACQSLRLGSGTRRHHKERSPSSPGSTIGPKTMMTAGRRRHTGWTRSDACVVCCESPLAATSSRRGAYSFSAPSSLPRLRSNVPSGR